MNSAYIVRYKAPGRRKVITLTVAAIICLSSCRKFITIDAPVTSINSANVYTNDATAAAVLTNIYSKLSNDNSTSVLGLGSFSIFTALSGDELKLYNLSFTNFQPYYQNDLTETTSSFWQSIYPTVFVINAAIEAVSHSSSLTVAVQKQLLGEARFMRAFCYFYLVNLYGDVPLVTTTDYKINAALPRTSAVKVYEQILIDLKAAQDLLSESYLSADAKTATQERVRPTKWAATALLARVYLFTKDYKNAEAEASAVINNSSLFKLSNLNDVFLKNSDEAIWQLQPVGVLTASNTGDGAYYILPETGPDNDNYPVYMNGLLANSFEAGDQRRINWVDSVVADNITYYYAYKYKIGRVDLPATEYVMVLRLAEQYLIRAEARTQLGNTAGAKNDLNMIRTRAGLPGTSALTPSALLTAIVQERRAELFTEWGHRWLDLKRTSSIDAVMAIATAEKGGAWKTTAQIFPIPLSDLQKDLHLTQNPGY